MYEPLKNKTKSQNSKYNHTFSPKVSLDSLQNSVHCRAYMEKLFFVFKDYISLVLDNALQKMRGLSVE